MDKLAKNSVVRIELLYPEGAIMNFPLVTNMFKVPLKARGNKIDYLALYSYVKRTRSLYVSIHGGICISKGSVICTNDIRSLIHKEYDPVIFRIKCTINALSSKYLAKCIVTISETSKHEICNKLKIRHDRVRIIYPGWEHIKDITGDETVWERIKSINKGEYYYSLSSRAPHKNFKWIEEVAKRNPNSVFLIGGQKWNNGDEKGDTPKNVIYLGYVSDSENVELMKNCKAFLHPAKYEGFGMTPLEALACGAHIIISNSSCLPEIFGDCASYFDPDNYDIDLNEAVDHTVLQPDKLLKKYSWDKAAKQWFDLIQEYACTKS